MLQESDHIVCGYCTSIQKYVHLLDILCEFKKNKKTTHISLNCVTIFLLQLMKPERIFLRNYLAKSLPVLK